MHKDLKNNRQPFKNYDNHTYCPHCNEELYRDGEGYWCYDCVIKFEMIKGVLK